jgi:ABC-2 type transport system permease protein
MKVLDIALKDLRRWLRNPFVVIMMFGAPLLITGLLYFAFGGLTSGGGGIDLPVTAVRVANLDQGSSASGGFSAGNMLVTFLRNEELASVVEVQVAADEPSARAAVESQGADVAVIIPADFTAAAISPGRNTAVMLYQDPTLTIGPRIVQDLVRQFIDGFSGAKIAVEVAVTQLQAQGVTLTSSASQAIAQQYSGWLETLGHEAQGTANSAFQVQSPSAEASTQTGDQGAEIIAGVMAGMLIFFAFFMGANGAESIVREDEEGTLARLFTTPTSQGVILSGKFAAVFLTLAIQIAVLLGASALIFGISWGKLPTVLLVSFGLTVLSAGFGILLMSFIKSTRQTGPVMGGVLTISGMLGGLFTVGIPNLPEALDTITLAMPQGWALEAWRRAIDGANPGGVLVPLLGMLGLGGLFLGVGVLLFRKRFD